MPPKEDKASTLDSRVAEQIKANEKALAATKMTITKAINRLGDSIKAVDTRADDILPTRAAIDHIYDLISGLRDKVKRATSLVDSMVELDPANAQTHLDKMGDYEDRVHSVVNESWIILNEMEALIKGQPPVGASGARCKEEKSLKPFDLTREDDPDIFDTWLKKFRAYYEASRMDLATENVQQAFMYNCMHKDLEADIRVEAEDDYTCFGTVDSIEKVMRDRWDQKFKTYNRRIDFFDAEKPQEMLGTDFAKKLARMFREAKINVITPEEVHAQVLVNACKKDEKLFEKLIKIEEPLTVNKVVKAMEIYESALRTKKQAGYEMAQVAQVQAGRGGGRGRGGGGGRGRGTGRGGGQEKPQNMGWQVWNHIKALEAKGLCTKCAEKHQGTCQFGEAECRNCGKKGHIAKACSQAQGQGQAGAGRGGGRGAGRGAGRGYQAQRPQPQLRSAEKEDMDEKEGEEEDLRDYDSECYNVSGFYKGVEFEDCFDFDPFLQTTGNYHEEPESYASMAGINLRHMEASTCQLRVRPSPRIRVKITGVPGIKGGFAKISRVVPSLPDTGADFSILNKRIFQSLMPEGVPLRGGGRIKLANGSYMESAGVTIIKVVYDDMEFMIKCLIADIKESFIIGWQDMIKLGLLHETYPAPVRVRAGAGSGIQRSTNISVNMVGEEKEVMHCLKVKDQGIRSLVKSFADVFKPSKALDPMKVEPVRIELDRERPDYKPLRTLTARTVGVHKQFEAAKTVQKLISGGVIKKYNKPTEWISPAMFVEKPDGSMRLVTDYKCINRFIRRPVHTFPSPRQVLKRLRHDSKYFLVADLVQGYHQIPICEEDQHLTAFILPDLPGIPSSKYLYARIAMGLTSSGDGFCENTDSILAGMDFIKIVDDILLQGKTREEVLEKFRELLVRCKKNNVSLSAKKLQFGTEVDYGGYRITSQGVKADVKKVRAIKDIPPPKDITALRSFMGLANNLINFYPDMAHLMDPLRSLLKKGHSYVWLPEHQEAFERVKEFLAGDVILKPYDPDLDTVLVTDASRTGMGYALMQVDGRGRPHIVQCGSRRLNKAELTSYSVNEIEATAILFGVLQSEYYVKWAKRPLRVLTDHRPLCGMFRKRLDEVSNNRMVRILEKLAGFNLEVQYLKGKENYIADCLSRYPAFDVEKSFPGAGQNYNLPKEVHNAVKCFKAHVHKILEKEMPECPNVNIRNLVRSADADPQYKALLEAVNSKIDAGNLPPDHVGRKFLSVWDDLRCDPSMTLVLYQDDKIVVPEGYRKQLLHLLHRAHAGTERTWKLAQKHYFWPGLKQDIKTLVDGCEPCQVLRPSQEEESLKMHSRPERPMQEVGMDLFEYNGVHYLVMADRYSGMIWYKRLPNQSAAAVINVVRSWFMELGQVGTVLSDSGPCFLGPFKEFLTSVGVRHEVSSPYHARSNGLAEAAVKVVKHLMKKVKPSQMPEAMRALRNTPRSASLLSPAEMFFGRRVEDDLPIYGTIQDIIRDRIGISEGDKHKMLNPGDRVRVQDVKTGRWDGKGTILSRREHDRSYEVELDDGRTFLRNRKFLKEIRVESLDEKGGREESRKSSSNPVANKHPVGNPNPIRRSERLRLQAQQKQSA